MIRTDRLPSGLTLVSEEMAEARSVCIGFWVGTGSRYEDPVFAGASHFLEHLLFKGTDDRSAAAIARRALPAYRPGRLPGAYALLLET